MADIITEIKNCLSGSLPGTDAHLKMAPGIRRIQQGPGPGRNAAVLLLLVPTGKELSLCFIQRTEYDGPHSGQISFPGGMYEEYDLSLRETALRESEEETGIVTKDVHILGELSGLNIPVSNFYVKPFAGYIPYYPEFIIDREEVDHIILIPLSHLIDPHNIKYETREFNGESFRVPYYSFLKYKIWGATAMMLCEFLTLVEEAVRDRYSPSG